MINTAGVRFSGVYGVWNRHSSPWYPQTKQRQQTVAAIEKRAEEQGIPCIVLDNLPSQWDRQYSLLITAEDAQKLEPVKEAFVQGWNQLVETMKANHAAGERLLDTVMHLPRVKFSTTGIEGFFGRIFTPGNHDQRVQLKVHYENKQAADKQALEDTFAQGQQQLAAFEQQFAPVLKELEARYAGEIEFSLADDRLYNNSFDVKSGGTLYRKDGSQWFQGTKFPLQLKNISFHEPHHISGKFKKQEKSLDKE